MQIGDFAHRRAYGYAVSDYRLDDVPDDPSPAAGPGPDPDDGWSDAEQAAGIIAGAERIWITGIGTSYHAALVGEWLLRSTGKDVRAVTSFDFATYPDQFPLGPTDAVIVQAHTGVKSYSALALQRAVTAGVPVISIGSETAEHPGSRLDPAHLRAREVSRLHLLASLRDGPARPTRGRARIGAASASR